MIRSCCFLFNISDPAKSLSFSLLAAGIFRIKSHYKKGVFDSLYGWHLAKQGVE